MWHRGSPDQQTRHHRMRGNQSESLGGLLQPGLPAGRPAGAAVRANAAARARGVASGAGVGAAACAAPLRAVRLSPDRSRPAPAAPDLPWRLHCLAPVDRVRAVVRPLAPDASGAARGARRARRRAACCAMTPRTAARAWSQSASGSPTASRSRPAPPGPLWWRPIHSACSVSSSPGPRCAQGLGFGHLAALDACGCGAVLLSALSCIRARERAPRRGSRRQVNEHDAVTLGSCSRRDRSTSRA